jgi:ElaB/YqjD/DUF883 family membrane-anchored ribosome-binding protein
MSRERFDLGKAPQISVAHCGGNLTVRGSIDSQVVVDGRDAQIEPQENGLNISSDSDLSLRLPEAASLVVERIDGNLAIKGISGDILVRQLEGHGAIKNVSSITVQQAKYDLALKNVNGDLIVKHAGHDLAVRNVGQINVGVVEGDFSARYATGNLSLASSQGDVDLRTINGNLTVQQIARDLNLRNLGGLVQVESVAGDIRLHGGLISGEHQLTADGDIVVIWPDDAPLNLSATAATIRNRLELADVKETAEALHGRLGDGQTNLKLTAGGQIVLKPATSVEWSFGSEEEFGGFDMDMSNLAEQISAQISSRMSDLSSRLEQKFGEQWGRTFEEKASKATQKAEEALRRAEKAMQQSRRPAGTAAVMMTPPPTAKERRATEAEQIKILRMVEQGIITPDEANTLLEALEQ